MGINYNFHEHLGDFVSVALAINLAYLALPRFRYRGKIKVEIDRLIDTYNVNMNAGDMKIVAWMYNRCEKEPSYDEEQVPRYVLLKFGFWYFRNNIDIFLSCFGVAVCLIAKVLVLYSLLLTPLDEPLSCYCVEPPPSLETRVEEVFTVILKENPSEKEEYPKAILDLANETINKYMLWGAILIFLFPVLSTVAGRYMVWRAVSNIEDIFDNYIQIKNTEALVEAKAVSDLQNLTTTDKKDKSE